MSFHIHRALGLGGFLFRFVLLLFLLWLLILVGVRLALLALLRALITYRLLRSLLSRKCVVCFGIVINIPVRLLLGAVRRVSRFFLLARLFLFRSETSSDMFDCSLLENRPFAVLAENCFQLIFPRLAGRKRRRGLLVEFRKYRRVTGGDWRWFCV